MTGSSFPLDEEDEDVVEVDAEVDVDVEDVEDDLLELV